MGKGDKGKGKGERGKGDKVIREREEVTGR